MSRAGRGADFGDVFNRLKVILRRHAGQLRVKSDTADNYSVETATPIYKGRPLFVAGIQVNKNYVSYHLMPVYASPELVRSLSPELRKRMQGKACFNFTKTDETLFRELEALTEAGIRKFRGDKFVRD